MEFVIGVGVFVLAIGAGIIALPVWLLGRISRNEKKALENATQLLDEAFDGRAHVSIRAGAGALPFEKVVEGARERGYALTHQAGDPTQIMTLMFEKA